VSQAAGGSHWSLIAYTRSDNTLRHYDTCRGMNRHAAKLLYAAILPVVEALETRFPLKLIESAQDEGDTNGFFCPQQENNYDCGMMVLAIAELLCKQQFTATGAAINFNIDQNKVSVRELDAKRREIHKMIINKAVESQQKQYSQSNRNM
jgi:sentrin-specific protease 8